MTGTLFARTLASAAIEAAFAAAQIVVAMLAFEAALAEAEAEHGLGDWQAELAVWPSLFMAAHGAEGKPAP